MRYIGIAEGKHDAALAIVTANGDIEYASHAERFEKQKIYPHLTDNLISMVEDSDQIFFYADQMQYLRSNKKEWRMWIDRREGAPPPVGWRAMRRWMREQDIMHHECHAAAAYYTRPWASSDDTVIVTIDGAGESQSCTISDSNFNILYEETIPISIGMMYAAVTLELGLTPLHDEYIVMGMASFGEPVDVAALDEIEQASLNYWQNGGTRQGYREYTTYPLVRNMIKKYGPNNTAASLQTWTENRIIEIMKRARKIGKKLVYSGGVAQNIMANTLIHSMFDEVWIDVNPTDGGAALGAAARGYCLENKKDRINYVDPYLGTMGSVRDFSPKIVAQHLVKWHMCGVIHGRSEYTPRALGNRSLLANPLIDIKDTVNKVKNRQKFRPFAPAILEEFVDEYFEGPTSRYMQYTAKALHDYRSVTHVDGTARVQTVPSESKSILRPILEEFYSMTGIPMLLNTSLNVRGKPMADDHEDGLIFREQTGVKVFG